MIRSKDEKGEKRESDSPEKTGIEEERRNGWAKTVGESGIGFTLVCLRLRNGLREEEPSGEERQ